MRFRLTTAIAFAACATLGLSACSSESSANEDSTSNETVTITHAQGESTIPLNPQRVVVFDQSVLQSMIDLDLPDAIGVPELTKWPVSLERYQSDATAKVGSLKEPDLEAVNALEPDLIIVAARSAAKLKDLNEIAPTIDLSVDPKDFFNSFEKQNRNLAAIYGAEDSVDAAFTSIRDAQKTVGESVAASGRRGLILRVEAAEATAYGPGSRYGIIHDLGVKPVNDNFTTEVAHGDAVSFEYIAEANPDVMFVQDIAADLGDTSGPAAAAVLDNDLVARTNAAKNNKIAYLDLYTWYMAPNAISSVQDQIKVVGDTVGA